MHEEETIKQLQDLNEQLRREIELLKEYINLHEPQDGAHTWRMKNLTCRSTINGPDMGSEGSWLYGTMISLYKLAKIPRIRDCVFERMGNCIS